MITSLRLKNFKSFSDSTLPLSAISLVFGANAVGKSNFFDALRFMKYMGEGRSIRDAIEGHTSFGPAGTTVTGIRGGAPEITRLGSQSTQFELTVSMHTRGGDVQYNICVDAAKYRVVQEEVTSKKHPGPYVFTTHPEPGPLIQEEDSPVLYARFYKGTRGLNPRRGFSPNESILSQFKGRAAESRLNEDAAQLVREELASIQPLELRPEVLRQYSALGRFQLGEHGENFAAVVWDLVTDARWAAENPDHVDDVPEAKAALDRYSAILAWLSELTPRAVTGIEAQAAPTGEVIFALQEAPFSHYVTARSLSDGTLRFAAFAFALLATGGRRTLLVEELENGINPARLQLLVNMLEQTTGDQPDAQVLATTHSPTVLETADEDTLDGSLVVGWDSDDQASRVEPLRALLNKLEGKARLADLQSEGWLQFAADR